MYNFKNDYNKGCHPLVLERLEKDNDIQYEGYAEDEICELAKAKIKKLLECDTCDLHFLSGGTQTNLVTISSILRPHQGVISASSGHIYVHETGAIEATGHAILPIESTDGKIYADQVENLIAGHFADETFEHTVQPGMVYISNPTEVGTIYKKQELMNLKDVCNKYEIPLYMDGARLASALTARENDLEFKDLCNVCDAFYIGGTKCGSLFGECLVIVNDKYKKDFRYMMKQRGALLAKSFVLGLQFDTLFTDNLYLKLGKYENDLANHFSDQLKDSISFFQNQVTNQIFPILSNKKIDELSEKYAFHVWEKIDENQSAIRICTSWGTDREKIDELINDIKK